MRITVLGGVGAVGSTAVKVDASDSNSIKKAIKESAVVLIAMVTLGYIKQFAHGGIKNGRV